MESILFNKSMELCDKVLDVSDVLFKKGKRNFANQLERCCTSIAANISESTQSESRADFIHKLKIASKESRETEFWLRIITRRKIVVVDDKTFDLLNHIQRMISKSIGTSKRKLNNSNNNSIERDKVGSSDNIAVVDYNIELDYSIEDVNSIDIDSDGLKDNRVENDYSKEVDNMNSSNNCIEIDNSNFSLNTSKKDNASINENTS